jgi:hypothetical protein
VLVGVAVVLLVGWTGYQALKAKTALEAVAADFDTLTGQLARGDQAAARTTLAQAQVHARDAADNTNGPGWWLSARIPQVGPNVRAVRSIAVVADRLTSDVLPDVISATGILDPSHLRPVNGRIDLSPIRRSAPAVVRAATRLRAEDRTVQAIDVGPLAPQIGGPVAKLQAKIAHADQLADRASRAVRLLPRMLGGDGTRRYLFIFQNNAEVRATGGIPGAFATMTARDGKISLGRQGDAGSISRFTQPPTPLTHDEKVLFGDAIGRFPQDVNFTPDFPRSARLIEGMYRASTGQTVDGVVSVDPVALSYLLRGTGPVKTVGGTTLDAQKAVPLLLSKVYAKIPDPTQQNVFFNAAARSVFDAVSAGRGDPRAVLDGVVQATSERRILVWSGHPDEQRLLAPTALAGALPTRADSSPQVGVYFNAAGAYKLDYYLDYTATVTSSSCRAGRQHLTVNVAMHSSVPQHYRSLPDYVDPVQPGFGRGKILVNAYLFAPLGGEATSLRLDGAHEVFNTSRLDGRTLIARTVLLKPGQTSVLSVDLVSGRGQTGTAQLRATPGVRSTGVGSVSPSACS